MKALRKKRFHVFKSIVRQCLNREVFWPQKDHQISLGLLRVGNTRFVHVMRMGDYGILKGVMLWKPEDRGLSGKHRKADIANVEDNRQIMEICGWRRFLQKRMKENHREGESSPWVMMPKNK